MLHDLAYPDGARESWSGLLRDLVRLTADALRARRDALVEMRRLQAEVARQASVIDSQASALAHSRKIIDRSSQQARIGVWECELPSGQLIWTDGSYDLFDLPRGSPITREQILAYYDPESVAALKIVRDRAIAECGQFSLDTRITTAAGRTRWIRITADVETEAGRPIRLFGMKQDVTEERALLDHLRSLAEHDPLTGLVNRARLEGALRQAPRGALLLIDLDGFKQVNDTYGHAAGDECLRQIAMRLREASPAGAVVGRLGGDEFVVVAPDVRAAEDVAGIGARLLASLRRPIAYQHVVLDLGASIGATLFGDGASASSGGALLEADLALYAAKGAGRGTCRLFTEALRASAETPRRRLSAAPETACGTGEKC